MRLEYKSKRLEKICTDMKQAQKELGLEMAIKLNQRISELLAAENIEILLKYQIGGFHTLKGNRKNQYAMKLVQPHRLILIAHDENENILRIIAIEDYH